MSIKVYSIFLNKQKTLVNWVSFTWRSRCFLPFVQIEKKKKNYSLFSARCKIHAHAITIDIINRGCSQPDLLWKSGDIYISIFNFGEICFHGPLVSLEPLVCRWCYAAQSNLEWKFEMMVSTTNWNQQTLWLYMILL